MLNFDSDNMVPHFIYCHGDYYYYYMEDLEKLILSRMRKYGLQSLILTTLYMERLYLTTKEKSKQAYEGKLKNKNDWKYYEGSINDDLESFFNNHQEISSLEEKKGRSLEFLFAKTNERRIETRRRKKH